jgi:thiol-disulfide isomerase/thioredoxin
VNARRNRLKRVAVIAFALLGLQGLGIWAYRTVESKKQERRSTFSFEPLTAEPQGLDAELLTPAGNTTTLRDGLGKPMLVHFWATWCAPCRTELPALLEFGRSRDVRLILVSVDESWQVVRHFFEGDPPDGVVLDSKSELRATFDVSTLPDTYLFDPSGRPVARFYGARDWAQAEANRELSALFESARTR